MENINIAKRFLEEGLIILSDVKRESLNEPIDSVIKRTVKKFEELGIEGTIGVFGDAPDISEAVQVKVIPWKERTEIGEMVEQQERERREEWDRVFSKFNK